MDSQRRKVNEIANFHKVTAADTMKFIDIMREYSKLIDEIVKRDELPEGNWVTSADCQFLIRR